MTLRMIALTLFLMLASAHVAPAATLTITREAQQDVMLTIYNGNLGLVKDVRETRLPPGLSEVQFMDVAARHRSDVGASEVADRSGRASDPRAELRVRLDLEPEAHGEVRGQEGASLGCCP
jgi:hypothetical protein